MRPAGMHLYKKVCPSVLNACEKTAFLGWFRPGWYPVLNLMINKRVLRVSFTIQSLHLSVHIYLHICHIFSQYTQIHSSDSSLPGRACSSFLWCSIYFPFDIPTDLSYSCQKCASYREGPSRGKMWEFCNWGENWYRTTYIRQYTTVL